MDGTLKRTRQPNYTEEEYLLLLQMIALYKDVIECKETKSSAWKQKDQAWEKIAQLFNAQNKTFRNKESLKKLYDNRKRRNPSVDMRLLSNGGSLFDLANIEKDGYDIANIKTNENLEPQVVTVKEEFENVHSNQWDEFSMVDRSDYHMDATCLRSVYRESMHLDNSSYKSPEPVSSLSTLSASPMNDTKNKRQTRRRKYISRSLARQYSKLTYLKMEVAKEELNLIKIKLESERLKKEAEERYVKLKWDREQEEYILRKRNLELDTQIKLLQIEKLKREFLV